MSPVLKFSCMVHSWVCICPVSVEASETQKRDWKRFRKRYILVYIFQFSISIVTFNHNFHICLQSHTHKPWKKHQACVWKSSSPITTLKNSILLQLFSFTLPAMIAASSVKHMLAAKRVGESITEAKGVRYVAYHNFFFFFTCQVMQLLKKCNEQMW